MMNRNLMVAILCAVALVAIAGIVLLSGGKEGAATYNYVTCCCNILTGSEAPYSHVRSQIQTFEANCAVACTRNYEGYAVLGEAGHC